MIEVVRFPSSVELSGTAYQTIAPVGTTEFLLAQFKGIDVDPTSVAEISGNTQMTLFIGFTIGALTKIQIRIYGSYVENPTSSDWFQEVIESDTAGVATLDKQVIELTSGTNSQIAYHVPIGAYKSLKVTAQASGTTSSGTLSFIAGLRTN